MRSSRKTHAGRRHREKRGVQTADRTTPERDRLFEFEALERLHRVTTMFLGGQPPKVILEEILRSAIAVTEADFGNIQMLDPKSEELEIVVHRGFPQWWLDFWNHVSKGTGVCGTALKRGERVIVEDVAHSPIFEGTPAGEIQAKAGIRAVQSTPLMSQRGTMLGMISTHFRQPGRPSDRALGLLDLLARLAADIIERTKAEEAVRFSEARFAGILRISADAIISVDAAQRITLWNTGAEETFGYTAEEVIGTPLARLIPERLREAVAKGIEQFASQDEVTRKVSRPGMPLHGLRKDGEEFPVEGFVSKLRTDGTLTLTASIRDVTQSRRMEAEQRVLADLGHALSSTLDYESTLTNVVRMAARELGELIGLYIVERGDVRRVRAASRHPTDSPWFAEVPAESQRVVGAQHPARQVIAAAKPVLLDISPEVLERFAIDPDHRRALESARIRSVMGIPLCIADECFGALVIQSSSRAYRPEDLRFAEEVGHRTALFIKNARLHQIAQRAIQDRDEVLRIVAHDLKNPLSTIVMEADLLRLNEHLEDHGPQDAADAITRAANRMTRLVQDLLDVSRMDSEPLAVTQARLSASAVVSDLAKLEEPLASAAGLAFRSDVAPDAGDVFADRDRLLQALENLVSNAIRHTNRGGRVTIGAKRNADAVVFSVSDTGSGIPKASLPHVFDRFARQRHVDKGSTGLGLPIVKGIVEAHGGNVWAESKVGAGSTFYFTIPTARAQRENAPRAE